MSLQKGVKDALLHTSTCLRDWMPQGTSLQSSPGLLLFQAGYLIGVSAATPAVLFFYL